MTMIPVAIGAVILGETVGLPLPHPPAWLFLGLAGYGLSGLMRHGPAHRSPVAPVAV